MQSKLILTFFGDDFSPEKFSQILNLQPTSVGYKGEPISKAHSRHRLETSWTKEFVNIDPVFWDDVINQLIEIVLPKLKKIKSINKSHKIETKVYFLVIFGQKPLPSIVLKPDFNKIISTLHATIEFDYYINNT